MFLAVWTFLCVCLYLMRYSFLVDFLGTKNVKPASNIFAGGLHFFLSVSLVDAFQYNDWNNARRILLVFTKARGLLYSLGEDAVSLLTLWNCCVYFEMIGSNLK